MDKFCNIYELTKLNQEAIKKKNPEKSNISHEAEEVIKTLPAKKSLRPSGFTIEFYRNFSGELMLTLLRLFYQIESEETLLNSLLYSKTRQTLNKRKKGRKKTAVQFP